MAVATGLPPLPSFLIGLLLLCGCAAGPPSVVSQIAASDLALVEQTTAATLAKGDVGHAESWSNPANGHLGTVMPLTATADRDGATCRSYQQTITIAGDTAVAYDTACRGGDGHWSSLTYATLSGAIQHGYSGDLAARYPLRYPYDSYYGPLCFDGDFYPYCYPYSAPPVILHRQHR